MQRDLASAPKMDSPGGVEERGQLGEAVTFTAGRDPGELAAHIRGE